MTIPTFTTIPVPPVVAEAIRSVTASGFFRDGIIGGSWCFPFYDALFDIKYELRTHDVDFMIHDALQKKKELVKDLESELENEGFISAIDYDSHLQKFYKDGMEVEFLTPRKGNRDEILRILPFNITAQPLPFLDILFHEPLSLYVESFGGTIRVPSPRTLLLHKMIIAHRRKAQNKKEKDLDQCKVLSLYCGHFDVQELTGHFKFSKATWKDIATSCQTIQFPELTPPA